MLAPLRFREFRLLFSARVISLTGSAIAPIALAFGVLQATGEATDLGIVLFARQGIETVLLLGGGVLADRIDRRLVMVGGSLASCISEAAIGALFLTHTANLLLLCLFAMIDGIGDALFFPASAGLTPSTVDPAHLQKANSLIGFARNGSSIFGAGVGGVLVAVIGPGLGIEIDSASFLAAAVLIALMHSTPARVREQHTGLFAELREGWSEFRSRTWLWAIVLQFAFVNTAYAGTLFVLVPLRARESYGGAGAYGLLIAVFSVGSLAGGALMLRAHPRRPLLIATLGILAFIPEVVFLAIGAPLPAVLVAAFIGGIGIEVFGVLWVTTMQREIPPDRLSRVSSYDALGSLVFTPVGLAVAAPVAIAVGLSGAFWIAALIIAAPTLLVLGAGDVRRMRSPEAASARSAS
ncbi:MAG TPA: MFS transporter [Candidatus Dormibacteraeota bacterium]